VDTVTPDMSLHVHVLESRPLRNWSMHDFVHVKGADR